MIDDSEIIIKILKHLNLWDVKRKPPPSQTARLWKRIQSALWRTPNLENALAWKELEVSNAVWAERYGGNFERAMEFLSASEEARIIEKEKGDR